MWSMAAARASRSKSVTRRGSRRPSSTASRDVAGEAGLVKEGKFEVGFVVAEHALRDDLAEQAGGDDVEVGVFFDVLDGDGDRGLVELFRRDSVKEGDDEFRGDSG